MFLCSAKCFKRHTADGNIFEAKRTEIGSLHERVTQGSFLSTEAERSLLQFGQKSPRGFRKICQHPDAVYFFFFLLGNEIEGETEGEQGMRRSSRG